MSAKHRTPEYQRNARLIRKRVTTAHANGTPVPCWRCRGPIMPCQPFDIGHLPGALASAMHELAPEHRHGTGTCIGNRADGGRKGAAKVNRSRVTKPRTNGTSWPI